MEHLKPLPTALTCPLKVGWFEEVFSTYLWTGNGTSQTITNGIDLSTKGGLVWIKRRDSAVNHYLATTNGGTSNYLNSNTTNDYEVSVTTRITSFNTDGFALGSAGSVNNSGSTFVGWTFRKQPKFFDVVTYTGDGTTNRSVAHNLQSMPGFVMIKRTDSTSNWYVAARMANTDFLVSVWTTPAFFALNSTGVAPNDSAATNVATDSVFYLKMGGDASASVNYTNINGASYVAYLFAHDAGGFGLTGTDNVISCGSYTGTGSTLTVTLGYEVQWLLVKRATGASANWILMDVMRGLSYADAAQLSPNTSGAENNAGVQCNPTATGFQITSTGSNLNNPGNTYIYIAIRRGPMKVPTLGTSVFSPLALSNTTGTKNTTGFPVDLQINAERNGVHNTFVVDRLRGVITNDTDTASPYLKTNATSAEATDITALTRYWDNTGFMTASWQNGAGTAYWNFRRAPSFFDEVCYTGTGSATTQTHNLAAVPELIIVKRRDSATFWPVYSATYGRNYYAFVNSVTAFYNAPGNAWGTTDPTSTTFSVGPGDISTETNASGGTYVAYLFATCAGVSKVGSYTGAGVGTAQTINCGFTAGARFVLIKRGDSSGGWFVYDSARGITSGNDPYLLLQSTDAEVTSTDYVNTASTGFQLTVNAPAALNGTGTYIFLAIA